MRRYPAKRGGKGALPKVLDVEVTLDRGGEYHARARNQSAAGHSPSYAVRRLAQLLGYRPSADVRHVRTDDAGNQHFQIVEVGQ